MQQALEFAELAAEEFPSSSSRLITALRERLEQPVQEPVAVVSGYYGGQCVILPTNPAMLFNSGTALYTTPPRREWVSLTVDEIVDAKIESVISFRKHDARIRGQQFTAADDPYWHFARAIEAKLREKNHG